MTPKEKAEQIFDLYFEEMLSFGFYLHNSQIRRLALIVVDEILKLDNPNTYNYLTENKEHLIVELADNYWTEVKKEIEAL